MRGSFRLGRIAGIDIGIHYTWLFVFALVTWSLAVGYYPATHRGWSDLAYWGAGLLSALALFTSVLTHELSHSLMARARGVGVDSITLFIFGGVSNLKSESENPQDEFLISIVGPLASFVLAGICWLALQALGSDRSPLGAILGYLALINALLGVFNLLPGFPLDGGRVLRSIVWAVTGSLHRATAIASFAGQGLGFLLILWGFWQFFSGALLNGLWTAFIGWFLNNAAETSRQQQAVQENLRGIPVGDLMNPEPPIAPPDLTVQAFVFDHLLRHGERAMLVCDAGRLLGIVSITDVKKLPREAWATTPVSAIMTPAPLKTVAPSNDLSAAVQLLVEGTYNQVPVTEGERVVGLLSRADILRFLQLRDELALQRLPHRLGDVSRPPAERHTEPTETYPTAPRS